LLDAFEKRYVGGGADDGRSGPESLKELARLCRDCLPGPLIDERRLDHLEERLEAAGDRANPPLVLGLEAGDELRNLPLEAGQVDPDFDREGLRSACLDDRVVVARRGSGPGLVADSELRALVVDCGEGKRLEGKSLEELCGKSVTVLSNPTYSMLEAYLAEEREHNVLVTIGHVERSSSGRLGSMTFADGLRPCTEVASLVARSLMELKVMVLGGCESWSSLAPAFEDLPAVVAEHETPELVLTSIPVLVAHHFKVTPATERGAVRALLRELGASGHVDVAFRAYRAALGQDDVCEKAMRCSAVLRLKGENLELVTRDTDHRKRLRYARSIRARYSRVRLPGDAERAVESLRSRGGYLERSVSYMVKAGGDRDGPGVGSGDTKEAERTKQMREHEQAIFNRLVKGSRTVVGLKAPAGVGKSALVHNVVYRLATAYLQTGSGPLPVCVELRGYGRGLRDLVATTLTEGMTIEHLEAAGYVLLADGLDEAMGNQCLHDELKALPHTSRDDSVLPPPSASLVSSRPESAHGNLPHFGRDREGKEEHVFQLEPWDLHQVGRYIAHHFGRTLTRRGERLFESIRSNPALVQLAAQPLLLWMLCEQAESAPVEQLPTTATELLGIGISRIMKRRNEQRNEARGSYRALGMPDLDLITELCWVRLHSEHGLTVRDARLVLLKKLLANANLAWELTIAGEISQEVINDLLEELVTRSGLLTATGPLNDDATVLSPSDVRFGEFLMARQVAEAINSNGWKKAEVEIDGKRYLAARWISCRAWLPEMKTTMAYLSGQLSEPGPMLTELASETPTKLNKWGDDHLRHRLAVAVECIAQLGCTDGLQALVDDITTQTMDLWWVTRGFEDRAMTHFALDAMRLLILKGGQWRTVPTIDRLIQMTQQGPVSDRCDAASAIATLVPNHSVTIDTLMRLTHDKDRSLRGHVAMLLAEIRPTPSGLVDRLMEMTDDVNPTLVYHATRALCRLDLATPRVTERLMALTQYGSSKVRYQAIMGLLDGSVQPRLIDGLMGLMDDIVVGRGALEAVKPFALATPAFAAHCLAIIAADNPFVFPHAQDLLATLDPATPGLVSGLLALSRNRGVGSNAREKAVRVLAALDPTSPAVSSRLVQYARNEASGPEYWLFQALAKLDPDTPDLVDCLSTLVRIQDRYPRMPLISAVAAITLEALVPSTMAPTSRDILDRLLRAMMAAQGSAHTAVAAVAELSCVPPEIIVKVIQLTRNEDGKVRSAAFRALEQLGTMSPSMLNAMVNGLKDMDGSVRSAAAYALGRLLPLISSTRQQEHVFRAIAHWVPYEYIGHYLSSSRAVWRSWTMPRLRVRLRVCYLHGMRLPVPHVDINKPIRWMARVDRLSWLG